MRNSKLDLLLAKLETMPMENDQNELIILDEKCDYLKNTINGANSFCNNGNCHYGGGRVNGTCTNGSCSGGHNMSCNNL